MSTTTSPQAPPLVANPVHMLGLSPEFSTAATTTNMANPTTSVNLPASQEATSLPQVTVQHPHLLEIFHGDPFEDAENWFDQYVRVAMVKRRNEPQKLAHAYFALENSSHTWYEYREANFQMRKYFRGDFMKAFSTSGRRDYAQQLIEVRIQKLNDSVAIYAKDMARLFRRADLDMSEAGKVHHVMWGIQEQLFAGAVLSPQPQQTNS